MHVEALLAPVLGPDLCPECMHLQVVVDMVQIKGQALHIL
jgi:hypothetical protein